MNESFLSWPAEQTVTNLPRFQGNQFLDYLTLGNFKEHRLLFFKRLTWDHLMQNKVIW